MPMKMQCIIVDDDENAISVLTEYISHSQNMELIKSFSNPVQALNYIRSNAPVDLIITDINMPQLNGIELSELIRTQKNKIIFTTSHAGYALDAFEVDADAFLLKPFGLKKFIATIDRLFSIEHPRTKTQQEDYFYIKSKEDNLKILKIHFSAIVAVESMLNYVQFHTDQRKVITHMTLKEANMMLQGREDFVQLHRSFIIARNRIDIIEGNMITMSSGLRLTIGERYRYILEDILNQKLIKSGQKG